jgi:uncharacterized protein (UPF0333 family)
MDNKSKELLVFLVVVIICSIAVTFYKTVIAGNFEIRNDIEVRE